MANSGFHRAMLRSFALLSLLGVLTISVGFVYLYRPPTVFQHHDRNQSNSISAATVVLSRINMATLSSGNSSSRVDPTSRSTLIPLIDQKVQCKTVCSNFSGGVCVPLNVAVFVYKAGLATENMTFNLQNHIPVRQVPMEINVTEAGSVKVVERCYLEEYFPGVELIPRHHSCAVIGNSGILNNSSCGDYIDSHDFVIRANMGLIKGYENDVGRKANLTAFNRQLLFKYNKAVRNTTDLIQLAIRKQLVDHVKTMGESSILWYPKQLYSQGGQFGSGLKFRAVIDTLRKSGLSGIRIAFSWRPIKINRDFGIGKTATLGLDAYAVARTICSNVTLFGFYPFHQDSEGRPLKYHYFDELTYNFTRRKAGHNFRGEFDRLKKLNASGDLTLVTRDCKPRL